MSSFVQAGRFTRGYHPDQVERFFAHAKATYEGRVAPDAPQLTAHQVRVVGFDLVRGGYDINQVDSAMDRLEDELARKERDAMRSASGDGAVVKEIARRASLLQDRLERPHRKRFDRSAGLFDSSYHMGEVDALCDKLRKYFLGEQPMSPDDVRRALFKRKTGKLGYRESQVDVYLDRVIEIMVMAD